MGSKTPSNRKETELGIPHPQLNHVRLADSNGLNCLRTTSCLDRKEYSRWKTALQLYKHHDSLFLPESHTFNATALCGAAGTAEIIYPNYPHLLNQEIYSRLGRGGEFSEPELWYLLLTVILAKKEAEEGGGELGDVRPRNILLNEQGCLKIPTLHSWPMEINKYQKMIGNTPTYVPPEELVELQSGCIEASSLAQAGEMFSIGLTMLSAANLQDYELLYHCETLRFDLNGLEQALSQLTLVNKYSEVLRSTIVNLCSLEPQQRMELQELWLLLGPHSDRITAKSNFVIHNAPAKLHEEVGRLRTALALKTAQYPSQFPQMTNQGLQSQLQPSLVQKLVPSHLDENTSSAFDLE